MPLPLFAAPFGGTRLAAHKSPCPQDSCPLLFPFSARPRPEGGRPPASPSARLFPHRPFSPFPQVSPLSSRLDMGGLTQRRFLKLRPVFRKPGMGRDCPPSVCTPLRRPSARPCADRLHAPAPTACTPCADRLQKRRSGNGLRRQREKNRRTQGIPCRNTLFFMKDNLTADRFRSLWKGMILSRG